MMTLATDSESESAHKLALARELLENIELSTLRPEQLLLKASRMARLVGDDSVSRWLRFELSGCPKDYPVAVEYLTKTGRWIEREAGEAYRESWMEIYALIESKEQELGASPSQYLSSAEALIGKYRDLSQGGAVTTELGRLRRIPSLILYWLHAFVSSKYYELAFSGLAESIFEKHKQMVDALLRRIAGEVLERIPAIYDRLATGDREAISQAMTTGRRVLAAFADSIQPPQQERLKLDGKMVEANGERYLNRLHYFIVNNCSSDRRTERLRNTIVGLNTRFGAAVHADVTAEEVRALFVLLYITLGEILSLKSGDLRNEAAPGRGDLLSK